MGSKLNLHPKVAAGLLASWVTLLIIYSLHQWAHVDPPAEVGAALTGVVGFAAGWLAPADATPPEPALAPVQKLTE